MSFVQQHNQVKGVWVKYHVASGNIVDVATAKFADVDEIQPIVVEKPQPRRETDPLEEYR